MLIKSYRNQKIIQLTVAVLWLIHIYFFVDSHIIQIGMFAFIILIAIAYSTELLTNIKQNEGYYIFETYSIITQKEEIKITESELNQIIFKNRFFDSYNLTINYHGKNGVVKKRLYVNALPNSELKAEINRIIKIIADKNV